MNTNEVIIPPQSILWNIVALVKEAENAIHVELQWGWTAGMTPTELEKIAEDCPTGFDSVTTTLDFAEELRDKLTAIIDANKPRHLELQAEYDRKFHEKYPNWNENLEKLMAKQEAERQAKQDMAT